MFVSESFVLQVGEAEYLVERGHSDSLGTDASARSPWTGVTQFLPTTQKIMQFSSGLTPKVLDACREVFQHGLNSY